MRTVIVFNHPYEGSYCNAILEAAKRGLRQNNSECDVINLDKDRFNPVMSGKDLQAFVKARRDAQAALSMVDPMVLDYKKRLERAEHLVFIFPIWWSLMPAMTKGFIDKVIFPAVAYEYDSECNMRCILPCLKRVTIINTMNTPQDIYRDALGDAVKKALFTGTFAAIGITDCRWITFNMVKEVSGDVRAGWLHDVEDYFATAGI